MKKILFITALCSFLLCILGGYYLTLWMGEKDKQKVFDQEEKLTQSIPLIDSRTKMVYQYYYSKDKVTKEQIEPAPQYLQGLNMNQLNEIYYGWQVVLFSPEKVILRCRIDGLSSETYILGEIDGYLAVFYEDAQKGVHLKEKTEVPLSALPEGEAGRIREGLRITGEENLASILSDYMS